MKPGIYITLALSLFLTGSAFAQPTYTGKTARAMPSFIGNLGTNVGTGFGQHRAIQTEDIDTHQPQVLGSNYLTDDWRSGKLYFTLNRVLETDQLKYDIENNQFLINAAGTPAPTPDDIRVFFIHNIDAFELADPEVGKRYFFNAANAELTAAGAPVHGFMEVLVNDAKLSLYRKVETELLRANYNVALNAGEKLDKILKKEWYFVKYGDNMEVLKVSNSRKKNQDLFQAHQEKMKQYMKSNKVDFNKEADLIRLVSYYNAL